MPKFGGSIKDFNVGDFYTTGSNKASNSGGIFKGSLSGGVIKGSTSGGSAKKGVVGSTKGSNPWGQSNGRYVSGGQLMKSGD